VVAVGGTAVGAAVAGACVATGAVVAGGCVATGAAVVAGAPQAESSMDAKTKKLIVEYNAIFLFISQSPFDVELRI
jgi:hypothetical protein